MSLNIKLGTLTLVDGSAEVSHGDTSLICSVTGPIEPKPRQELPTELALEVVVRPAKGVPNTREKLLEDKLRAVLTPIIARHQYPRQLCQITIQILNSGEPEEQFSQRELSTAINASLLALLDAGVALLSLCVSVPLAISKKSRCIIAEPNSQALKDSESVHVLALQISTRGDQVQNILLLDSYGNFSDETIFTILETGEKKCILLLNKLITMVKEHNSHKIIV